MEYREFELRNISRRVRTGMIWEVIAAIGLGVFFIPVDLGLSYYPFTERHPLVGPLLGAALYKLVSVAWTGTIVLSMGAGREFIRSLRTKGTLIIFVGAVVGGSVGTSGIFVGSAYVGAAMTSSIVALSPLFSIAGAHILFGEKITRRMMLAACVVVVGAIAVYSAQLPSTGSFDSMTLLGLLAATLGALGWGLEGPIATYALDVLDTTVASFIRYLVDAACGWSIVILVLGATDLVTPSLTSEGLPFIFLAGLAASTAFIAWFRGLPMIGVGRGTAILNTYPLFTVFLLMLSGEMVSVRLVIGCVLMVIGLFVLASEPKEWLQVLRSRRGK